MKLLYAGSLFLCALLTVSSGKKTLHISFLSYQNPSGEEMNGDYCAGGNKNCNTYFEVCLEYLSCATNDITKCSESLMGVPGGSWGNYKHFDNFDLQHDIKFQQAGGLRLKVLAKDYVYPSYPLIDLYMMDFPLNGFSTTKKVVTMCGTRNAQNGVPLTEISLGYFWTDDGAPLGPPGTCKSQLPNLSPSVLLSHVKQQHAHKPPKAAAKERRLCFGKNNLCQHDSVCVEEIADGGQMTPKCYCSEGFRGHFCEQRA